MKKGMKLIIFIAFILFFNTNVYAASSCYRCQVNSNITFSSNQLNKDCIWTVDNACNMCYRCDFNGNKSYQGVINETDFKSGKCQPAPLEKCVNNGIAGTETRCKYTSSNNGNTLVITLAHDIKQISSIIEYNNSLLSSYNLHMTYATYQDEYSESKTADCEQASLLCVTKSSNTKIVDIDLAQGGKCSKNSTKFYHRQSDTVTNNYQYCLYELPNQSHNDLKLISSGSTARDTDISDYQHIKIAINLNTGKVASNKDILPTGSGFNPTKSTVLDPSNQCNPSLKYSDEIGQESSKPVPGSTPGSSYKPIDWNDPASVDCEGIIGPELLELINKIFNWIKIIAPIIVIVLSSIDFAGALLQDDRDAVKKATSKFVKRLIIAVAIFFIPLILQFILNAFNNITSSHSSVCGIGSD